jgi:hypothetical protein
MKELRVIETKGVNGGSPVPTLLDHIKAFLHIK